MELRTANWHDRQRDCGSTRRPNHQGRVQLPGARISPHAHQDLRTGESRRRSGDRARRQGLPPGIEPPSDQQRHQEARRCLPSRRTQRFARRRFLVRHQQGRKDVERRGASQRRLPVAPRAKSGVATASQLSEKDKFYKEIGRSIAVQRASPAVLRRGCPVFLRGHAPGRQIDRRQPGARGGIADGRRRGACGRR